MRVLIFHGYLLRGTGSNVYNANLAAALARLGHEVHLLCQDLNPPEMPGVHVHNPDIGRVLPVYVADRYEGFDAKPFPELTDDELERYLEANVAAVREVVAAAPPDAALANHLVMGPAIVRRGLDGAAPYAVKVHGSALEYTVKPHPERFMPYAREGIEGASAVLVGSDHTAQSLWAAMDDPSLPQRTRLGPPGVDVEAFAPREPEAAAEGVRALTWRLAERAATQAGTGEAEDVSERSSFHVDEAAAAAALARLRPGEDRLVAFVGKLIVSKGIDLLVAAWPLVLAREPRAKLVVVGFGAYREAVEAMVGALATGDLGVLYDLARRGRGAEGGPSSPLTVLGAFLDRIDRDGALRVAYLRAAADMTDRVVLTGRLEHDDLADLLPACEALVTPSTFPEAFGMVAAEGAACGALPISAGHSGLAEVTQTLAAAVPEPARDWLSVPLGERAVEELAERVIAWLGAPESVREPTRRALVATVGENWSWEGVARGVLAAATGRSSG
ncbi:MAG TPA: glycosyltransferase family 4 protein [Solirubrobacteraceae bacterium]|nr:glycosyltransferase family 4 protein [Solirubrobacteraceae bacterium]